MGRRVSRTALGVTPVAWKARSSPAMPRMERSAAALKVSPWGRNSESILLPAKAFEHLNNKLPWQPHTRDWRRGHSPLPIISPPFKLVNPMVEPHGFAGLAVAGILLGAAYARTRECRFSNAPGPHPHLPAACRRVSNRTRSKAHEAWEYTGKCKSDIRKPLQSQGSFCSAPMLLIQFPARCQEKQGKELTRKL